MEQEEVFLLSSHCVSITLAQEKIHSGKPTKKYLNPLFQNTIRTWGWIKGVLAIGSQNK